jgi:Na+/H+-dicarboxylate symporter
MAKAKLKCSTATLNFIAMIIGAVLGLVFGEAMGGFKFIGDIWLNTIKMVVVPLIMCIMVNAVGSQTSLASLGRVAVKIIVYYALSTALATTIGLTVASILKPGAGVNLAGLESTEITGTAVFTSPNFIKSLFSDNMFASFASGNIIQVMVISILLGIAILNIKNTEHKEFILKWFQSANDMFAMVIGVVIKASPVGVLFLMADTFGKYGFAIFTSIAGLIGTFWISVLTHVLLVYSLLLWVTAGINPIRFLKDSSDVWTFTIASCSSAATIPVNTKCAKEKFGVPSRIADFTIPLGAQINYDGSAISYGCVLIFISQLYGIPFDIGTLIKIVIVSTLISSGGGGIPGSGIVKMLVVVQTFGLPVEIVGIIAGFYRFFDMGTTTGNCMGDLAGTIFVSKWEEKIAKKTGTSLDQVTQNL